jgi:hypothetical protein
MNRAEYLEREYRRDLAAPAGNKARLRRAFLEALPRDRPLDLEIVDLALRSIRDAFTSGEIFAYDRYIAMEAAIGESIRSRIIPPPIGGGSR